MKIAVSGLVAAAVAVVVAGTASAQTTYQTYQAPTQTQTQPYAAPGFPQQQQVPAYTAPGTTTTQTYQFPQQPTYQPQPGFPVPQPYLPGQQVVPGFPPPPPPANPAPAPNRNAVPDTDAWTFSMARYYPAIQACLRNTDVDNPVIANVQERRNATVMIIGQGGTADYEICRTGLNGTRVRDGEGERSLPPAFYAPLGSSFTITPDRPFQPVVDTGQRVLGWIVRTQPVRLDVYGRAGGTFDGQYIRPVTVNPDAR